MKKDFIEECFSKALASVKRPNGHPTALAFLSLEGEEMGGCGDPESLQIAAQKAKDSLRLRLMAKNDPSKYAGEAYRGVIFTPLGILSAQGFELEEAAVEDLFSALFNAELKKEHAASNECGYCPNFGDDRERLGPGIISDPADGWRALIDILEKSEPKPLLYHGRGAFKEPMFSMEDVIESRNFPSQSQKEDKSEVSGDLSAKADIDEKERIEEEILSELIGDDDKIYSW